MRGFAIMLTVFGFAGCGIGSADHQDAGRDAGIDSTTDRRFVCKSNTDCSAPTPVCNIPSGVCLGCLMDTDCTTATNPICDLTTNTCRGCKADSECVSTGPGVCMFQSDGHCATDTETVYVQPTKPTGCIGTATSDGGMSGMPFCSLSAAFTSAGTRTLFVLRGGSIAGGVAVTGSAPLNIVGQMSATITAAAGQAGLHITGTDVYIRDVLVLGAPAATIGIIADGSATLRLDGVDIENMPEGGLRVTAAGYDVVNSIFAGNGGVQDEVGRLFGGAYLSPASSALSRFAFNTVVNNKRDGVTCASITQVIDASLLAGNFSGVADNTGCTLATSHALGTSDPMLTSTYRATATSPCVDFVKTPPAGAPDHDIDTVTRPQGQYFDCGASEYKAP
jgi:hypothetical protein